jgi:hypothetical protein
MMASKKQVADKAAKLGGQLIVDRWGREATLLAPKGKLFDGLHYSNDYFEEGKQVAWDGFWEAMKTVTDCDCGCGK